MSKVITSITVIVNAAHPSERLRPSATKKQSIGTRSRNKSDNNRRDEAHSWVEIPWAQALKCPKFLHLHEVSGVFADGEERHGIHHEKNSQKSCNCISFRYVCPALRDRRHNGDAQLLDSSVHNLSDHWSNLWHNRCSMRMAIRHLNPSSEGWPLSMPEKSMAPSGSHLPPNG